MVLTSATAALHNHISLAHNTSLRSLAFGGLSVTANTSFLSDQLFPWVTLMLADLQSPLLREITFELETPLFAGLGLVDWARIDAELSKREFSDLTLQFYINCDTCTRGSEMDEEIRDLIIDHLPGFKGRGTVRVSCI